MRQIHCLVSKPIIITQCQIFFAATDSGLSYLLLFPSYITSTALPSTTSLHQSRTFVNFATFPPPFPFPLCSYAKHVMGLLCRHQSSVCSLLRRSRVTNAPSDRGIKIWGLTGPTITNPFSLAPQVLETEILLYTLVRYSHLFDHRELSWFLTLCLDTKCFVRPSSLSKNTSHSWHLLISTLSPLPPSSTLCFLGSWCLEKCLVKLLFTDVE